MNQNDKLNINIMQQHIITFRFSKEKPFEEKKKKLNLLPHSFSRTHRKVAERDADCGRMRPCTENGASLKASRDCRSLRACSHSFASQSLHE